MQTSWVVLCSIAGAWRFCKLLWSSGKVNRATWWQISGRMPWDNTDGKQPPRCISKAFGVSLHLSPHLRRKKSGNTRAVSLPRAALYAYILCTFLRRSLPRTECQLEVCHKRRGLLNHQWVLSWGTASIAKLERCWIAVRKSEFMARTVKTIFDRSVKVQLWINFLRTISWPGLSSYIFSILW